MAVFDIFKRFKTPAAASVERREDERLRASLGARVLVVDDSATIRAVLGKMLMQDGYEVLKAADGESAIEGAALRHAGGATHPAEFCRRSRGGRG